MPAAKRSVIAAHPLTPDRWPAFEALFGARGACGGCWCMTPRLPRAEYERNKGAGNKRLMRARVEKGPPPGLLLFEGGAPVGWVSIEPRDAFPPLARSRVLAPVDSRPVWSITCLFVAKDHRGRGLSRRLIDAAVAWARGRGADLVEAYPVEPRKKPMPAVFAWTGIASSFRACGFEEAARRSPTRPIMRRTLRARRQR